MVELMVAMLLSIFLLGGILSVYLSSKRSYQSRDGLSMVQENGRVAIKRLRQGLLQAGYPSYDLQVPVVLAANAPEAQWSGQESLAGDAITAAFLAGGEVYDRDCLGQGGNIKKGDLVMNRFFVQDGSLKCRGSNSGSVQPLADGIERMEVLYGLDTLDATEVPDGVPNRYVTATELEALAPELWLGVVSVRIALLVSSINNAKDALEPARHFNLLGTDVVVPSDLKTRRVFTTTIPLRNRMPQP